MNNERITRLIDDCEIKRADASGGRILVGRAIRYGVPYEVSDDGGRSFYHEVWRAGVFSRSISHKSGAIPLHFHHRRDELPFGVAQLSDTKADLMFNAPIVRGERGDEMLELIEMGAVLGVSLGASPIVNEIFRGEGVERVEAKLNELSLTAHAQIGDGEVLAIRAITEPENNENDPDEDETPNLDEARQTIDALERP